MTKPHHLCFWLELELTWPRILCHAGKGNEKLIAALPAVVPLLKGNSSNSCIFGAIRWIAC